MPNFSLKDLMDSAAKIAGQVVDKVAENAKSGVEAANDAGKKVKDTVTDTASKTASNVGEFGKKAGQTALDGARKGAQLYTEKKENIDAGMMAYPIGQTLASSAIARTISTKLLGLAGGAFALKAAPIILTVAAIYYGKDIVNKATDILKQGDTLNKARKGDKDALKTMADTIAAVVVNEKSEAEAKEAAECDDNAAEAQDAIEEIKEEGLPVVANDDEAPKVDNDPQP